MSSTAQFPRSREPAGEASRFNSILFCGVFALLLLLPLCFGAVEPWAIFALEAGSAALFLSWVILQLSSAEKPRVWSPIFAPMLMFGGLVLLQLATNHTMYRYATVSGAALYCGYGVLCFLVVQSFRSTRQARILAFAFTAYGFAVAAFALLQGLSSNGKLYWLRLPRSGGWIYGPYVNHNHYAGLMEILFPIPLVFSLTAYAKGEFRILAILASAVMAVTIFLSGSRGGVVAFVGQIIFLVVALLRERSRIPFRGRLALAFFAVLSVSMLAWVGGRDVAARMGNAQSTRRELTTGLRVQIDRDLIKMFPHRPLLGWGLGTFAEVYPRYRTFYTRLYIDQAHNDYLQLLIEMGAAGFLTGLWLIAVVFRGAWKKLRNWTSDVNGAVALAALTGITGILIHSFVDFNLQIPANAALFYVLCTIAAMDTRFTSPRGRAPRPENV